MKLIIATQNEHKFQEIKAHFKGFPIVIEKLPEGIKEPVESKDTFLENAILKAKYYADKLNQVVLADDSGLCVAALKGLPGIYSSRYSGLGDAANNVKLLKALTNIEQRDAYFKAVIVIYFPDGTMFHYEGMLHGKIHSEVQGDDGFGYDPIFIPNQEVKTLAVLGSTYKNVHSHRAKALNKLLEAFDEITDYWRYTRQK